MSGFTLLSDAVMMLHTDAKTMRAVSAHELAILYRGAWGNERIRTRDLEKWQAALIQFEQGNKRLPGRPTPAVSNEGFTYYIQAELGGPIKVGSSTDPLRRMADLQAGCPFLLKLLALEPGGERIERQRHYELRFWRLHGEWFQEDSPELRRRIKTVRKEWGRPRKNALPSKIESFARSTCASADDASTEQVA